MDIRRALRLVGPRRHRGGCVDAAERGVTERLHDRAWTLLRRACPCSEHRKTLVLPGCYLGAIRVDRSTNEGGRDIGPCCPGACFGGDDGVEVTEELGPHGIFGCV